MAGAIEDPWYDGVVLGVLLLLPERIVCMHGLSSYDNWWMVALCVAIMRKNNSCIVLYNTQDKHYG